MNYLDYFDKNKPKCNHLAFYTLYLIGHHSGQKNLTPNRVERKFKLHDDVKPFTNDIIRPSSAITIRSVASKIENSRSTQIKKR